MLGLNEIQELYDGLCKKHKTLSVKAYFVSGEDLDYKGLYIERPFRKIYLNQELFNTRTVYHEFFHHLNPSLHDGEEFEKLLNHFIYDELRDKKLNIY
jgi:hypothetical protein